MGSSWQQIFLQATSASGSRVDWAESQSKGLKKDKIGMSQHCLSLFAKALMWKASECFSFHSTRSLFLTLWPIRTTRYYSYLSLSRSWCCAFCLSLRTERHAAIWYISINPFESRSEARAWLPLSRGMLPKPPRFSADLSFLSLSNSA